jgi:hypothetical protein
MDGLETMRNQNEARRVLEQAAPYQCCAVCGGTHVLTVAHLDHDAANNSPTNLAWLCWTHHRMYDAGLYPVGAIRQLQAHWQATKGVPDYRAVMKDAGAKAAKTRASRMSEIAARAHATRRRNLKAQLLAKMGNL